MNKALRIQQQPTSSSKKKCLRQKERKHKIDKNWILRKTLPKELSMDII